MTEAAIKRRPKTLVTELATADRLSMQDVAQRLRVSVRTCWRMAERGDFPPVLQFSKHTVGVRTRDYLHWIDNRPNLGSDTTNKNQKGRK